MPATQTKNKSCITYEGRPKDRFETRSDAITERERRYATGRYAAGTIGAYECDHCPYFHVAHRRVDASTRGGARGGKRSGGRRQGGRR